jgi:hypothetical protein
LPDAVFLKRFAAARLLFIFGIPNSLPETGKRPPLLSRSEKPVGFFLDSS